MPTDLIISLTFLPVFLEALSAIIRLIFARYFSTSSSLCLRLFRGVEDGEGGCFFFSLGEGVAEVMATLSSVTPHLLGATGNLSAETADYLELLSSPSGTCDIRKIDLR